MQRTSEPLFSELNRLRMVFSPLRDRLAEAGKQFHESAVPLPEDLVSDLADFKKSVAELGNRVQGLANELSLSKDLPVADLDEIGRALDTIAREEQRTQAALRENAVGVLDRVLRIVRQDRTTFPPLLNCQALARDLRDQILRSRESELHPAAKELSDGKHVLSGLLDLIEKQDSLADDEYLRLQDMVGESFGNDLAIAATRGKLEVQPLAPRPAGESVPAPEDKAIAPALAPPLGVPDVQTGVEEAIRLANLCREQGKHSEADMIYQRLLEVPTNAAGPQSPRKAETLQEFASARAGSLQTAPAQRVGMASGSLTAVEGDIGQEIDTILENISQLAAKAAESASTGWPPAGKFIATPDDDTDAQRATGTEQMTESPQEAAQAMYARAESIGNRNREHPLRAHPSFMNPEASRPGLSRPMLFGGVATAMLAVALLAYTMWRPAVPDSPTNSPSAAQVPPASPDPTPQPQEQVQPTAAAEQAGSTKTLIPQMPGTPSPAPQPLETSQSGSTPLQTGASQLAAPPVRVTLRPVQEPQGATPASVVPKPLAARKDVPEPPRLATGTTGISSDGEKAVGAALSGLVNPVASIPPPPSVPSQEPVRVGGQLQAAKLVHMTLPEYPSQYRQAHIQGTVRLEAVISKDGAVQKLTVISGNKFLNGSAIQAVKQWRYQPTVLNGEPVAVITTVDVNFTINQ